MHAMNPMMSRNVLHPDSRNGVTGMYRRSRVTAESAEDRVMLPLDENERLLSLQVALKCADIGHLAASMQVSRLLS
jgi:hypothetical protein